MCHTKLQKEKLHILLNILKYTSIQIIIIMQMYILVPPFLF